MKKFGILFLIAQVFAIQIVSHYPLSVEKYYSNGLYKYISSIENQLFSKIYFSVGDCLYLLLFVFIVWYIGKGKTTFKERFYKAFSVIAVLYFFFNLFWGLNYYRQPLTEKLGFENQPITSAEVIQLTDSLVVKCNKVYEQLQKHTVTSIVPDYSIQSITQRAEQIIQQSVPYYSPKISNPTIKPSLYSLPLSYMGFGGYLNPFTNEAQYNYLVPTYTLPTLILHELSHQKGIASESEANFIAYQLSIQSSDLYFQYSGYCYALRYCLSQLERISEGLSKGYIAKLHSGIQFHLQQSEAYKQNYKTVFQIVFQTFYNNYLKLNSQKDGLKEYSKFIALLINYNKTQTVVI